MESTPDDRDHGYDDQLEEEAYEEREEHEEQSDEDDQPADEDE